MFEKRDNFKFRVALLIITGSLFIGSLFLFPSCATGVQYTYYDVGFKITVKIAQDEDDDYDYWYKLVDSENGRTMGFYSNKNYRVNDVIQIGAIWGKQYEQNKE